MSSEDTENEESESITGFDFTACSTVRTGNYEKNDVILAIQETGGHFSKMGRLLQKSRNSVKHYVDQQQDLLLLVADQRESMLDDIEQSTFNKALMGDTTNQRFLLTTIGKNRGYVTKTESDVNHSVDPSMSAMLQRVAERGKKIIDKDEEE